VTTKQLFKLAKLQGWTKKRNGGSHYVFTKHEHSITIPYHVKNEFTGKLIARQLQRV